MAGAPMCHAAKRWCVEAQVSLAEWKRRRRQKDRIRRLGEARKDEKATKRALFVTATGLRDGKPGGGAVSSSWRS